LKIGIGFSYFDSEKEIPRALDPVYKHVYKIYAIDGRYINYETDHDLSIDGSTELLKKRYPNVVVDEMPGYFQTKKRQRYFDLAAEDHCDYVIVWDSDDIIYPDPKYQDWDKFYKNIEKYSKKFPNYRIFQMYAWIPSVKKWRKAFNDARTNSWKPYIRIHKNPEDMRYAMDCHWYFAPRKATDEQLIKQTYHLWKADHTIDGVRITTDSALRGEQQLKTRDGWAWNTICEEHRRSYLKTMDFYYGKKRPPENGYWRYDKAGRMMSKICDEDPEKIVIV